MFLRRRPLRNRIQTKRALASWIPSLWLMTQRRGKCDLIDPAFENQNFWKDFNPHLETELLYLDDSVSLAGPSFTFEVKVGLLVLEHLTAKRPLNFVTYKVFFLDVDSISKKKKNGPPLS